MKNDHPAEDTRLLTRIHQRNGTITAAKRCPNIRHRRSPNKQARSCSKKNSTYQRGRGAPVHSQDKSHRRRTSPRPDVRQGVYTIPPRPLPRTHPYRAMTTGRTTQNDVRPSTNPDPQHKKQNPPTRPAQHTHLHTHKKSTPTHPRALTAIPRLLSESTATNQHQGQKTEVRETRSQT